MVGAISQSERSDSELLALIAQMIAVGDLTQQDAVDVYVGLLIAWDWRDSALEIMEQLARTIQQHANRRDFSRRASGICWRSPAK